MMQNLTLEEGKCIYNSLGYLYKFSFESKWLNQLKYFYISLSVAGGLLQVESATLPVATFAKFQPHSTEFLEMTNPKAVLAARLRNFACLSKGDVIAIMYNNKIFEMSVLETKPSNAVSVIGNLFY